MPSSDDRSISGANLVSNLIRMASLETGESRARLARLRRSLSGKVEAYAGLREIGQWMGSEMSDRDINRYLLVAGLFSINPVNGNDQSFGITLRKLSKTLGTGASSLDLRVQQLLEAEYEDLGYYMRQLVQLLRTKNLPVNYYSLERDLNWWSHQDRFVQRRWARHYYVGVAREIVEK